MLLNQKWVFLSSLNRFHPKKSATYFRTRRYACAFSRSHWLPLSSNYSTSFSFWTQYLRPKDWVQTTWQELSWEILKVRPIRSPTRKVIKIIKMRSGWKDAENSSRKWRSLTYLKKLKRTNIRRLTTELMIIRLSNENPACTALWQGQASHREGWWNHYLWFRWTLKRNIWRSHSCWIGCTNRICLRSCLRTYNYSSCRRKKLASLSARIKLRTSRRRDGFV